MRDADPRAPEPLNLIGVEMDAVRDPGPGRKPAGVLQKID